LEYEKNQNKTKEEKITSQFNSAGNYHSEKLRNIAQHPLLTTVGFK